jgi:hypothetical protein
MSTAPSPLLRPVLTVFGLVFIFKACPSTRPATANG